MRHCFVVAIFVVLLAPAIAQAHRKPTRRSQHRTTVGSSQRLAKQNVTDTGRDSEIPSNALPLSWLLVILTGVVAVAFVAFTGMFVSPENRCSPQPVTR